MTSTAAISVTGLVKSYGNVEGIAWLSPNTLVAVSDQKKRRQPAACAKKDQSIHLFRIPLAE